MKRQQPKSSRPGSMAGARHRHPKDSVASRSRASAAKVREALRALATRHAELQQENDRLRQERRQVEGSLARYTELFEYAPIGYATVAMDGRIREVNQAGMRLLGLEHESPVGRHYRDFVRLDDRGVFDGLLVNACESGQRHSCAVQLARGDVGPLYARITVRAIVREEGLLLIAFEDISERMAREEQLERTQALLLEAEQRKNDFLAVLSHELRNPLSAIRNAAFVISRTSSSAERALKAHAVIDRQITHVTRLVDDLLDVTRIARGKIRLQHETVDLRFLVHQAVEDQRGSFETSGILLESRLDPGEFRLEADPARLTQVMQNALGNAEKFTPSGGRVTVTLQRQDRTAVLRIEDTGAGIEPELQRYLFEPFAQAPHTMDRTRGGLGLGLAMVKGLVELHGGSVGITSSGEGCGTELEIVLPLDDVASTRGAITQPDRLRPRRVLLIEDNRDSAMSLRDALVLGGHEVELAFDGRAGLEVAHTFLPDVVICDIGLPVMNGYDFAKSVRADPAVRQPYLIALSGYALPHDIKRAIDAGFDRHIAKPPNMAMLGRLILEVPQSVEVPGEGLVPMSASGSRVLRSF